MNVVSSRPVKKLTEEKASKSLQKVDFYEEVPHYELSLDEFEEYALARLKVSSIGEYELDFCLINMYSSLLLLLSV